jgi:hypothetical protein
MGMPERDKGGKETEEIFDVIMTENFTKLVIDNTSQIHEIQKTQSRKIPKATHRHIILFFLHFLLLYLVRVHCGICKSSHNISSILEFNHHSPLFTLPQFLE